jgi:brefeldin A-inhibited guanine nucleotide-exchange protein
MTNNKFQAIQNQRAKKTKMGEAALKFGQKPKYGIKLLVQYELIANPDEDYKDHVRGIVNFLKTAPNLDKTKIGEFLGGADQLSKDALEEFINQYDLKNKEFVPSLRAVLLGFRLPGEGQVVDRVMECFGNKYISDNPEGADSC